MRSCNPRVVLSTASLLVYVQKCAPINIFCSFYFTSELSGLDTANDDISKTGSNLCMAAFKLCDEFNFQNGPYLHKNVSVALTIKFSRKSKQNFAANTVICNLSNLQISLGGKPNQKKVYLKIKAYL